VLGYSADLSADSDFVRLRSNAAYTELTRQLERNRAPVVASEVAFELPERELLIEGIAHDPREDVFYVGSVHQANIFRVTRSGSVTQFATGELSRWAPLGLRVDQRRNDLWVATAALPQTAGYSTPTAAAARSSATTCGPGGSPPAARFTLAPAGDRLVAAELLERAHPQYQEPTLGVLVAGDMYYVANSQWAQFSEDGRVGDPESLEPTVVLRLRL
jgi:hypothetical protein